MNIDVHTSIGWRGIDIVGLESLRNSITKKTKFGLEYDAVSDNLDALIYAYSHVLEKGFVVNLEFKLLSESLNKLKTDHPNDFIANYIHFLTRLKANRNFPMFLPTSLTWSSILRASSDQSMVKKYSTATKITGMQSFWRVRYAMKNKLPFELPKVAEA
jgi:hypothetical protein